MSVNQLQVIYHGVLASIYLICLVSALRRRGFHDAVARLLGVYLSLGLLWEILAIVQANLSQDNAFVARLPQLLMPVLAFLLLQLTAVFLTRAHLKWFTWLLGFLFLVFLLWVSMDMGVLPETLAGFVLDQSLIWLGWGISAFYAAVVVIQAFRSTDRMSNRNRLIYWILALVMITVGELLFLLQQEMLGSAIRMAGVILLVVILLAHRLPEFRVVMRRLTSGLLVGAVELALYTLGFVGLQYALRDVSGYDPLFIGLALALILGSILSKFISGFLGGKMINFSNRESILIGSSTIPQLSTTLAVVFIGFEMGILSETLLASLVMLSIVTTVIGPIFLKFATKNLSLLKDI